MKLIFLIIFGVVSFIVLRQVFKKTHLKHFRKFLLPGLFIFIFFVFVLSALHDAYQPDKQCLLFHKTTSNPPLTLISAADYLYQGDFDYERGDCGKALSDYTKAIEMNPNFAEAYNNRAYTYMRMRTYPNALTDLNKALELHPNYIHALMNRGDIYNYY
jgi:tetratricopeptide (TPR) repeat protein